MSECVYMCIHACRYGYMYIYVYEFICICICICLHINECACIYVYMCVYSFMNMYTYVYMYTYTSSMPANESFNKQKSFLLSSGGCNCINVLQLISRAATTTQAAPSRYRWNRLQMFAGASQVCQAQDLL